MNIEFLKVAVETTYQNAEKAYACGLSSCVAQYKIAAKKYKELASCDSANSAEYISKAEECENKANNFGKNNVNNPVVNNVNKNNTTINNKSNNNTINKNNSNFPNFAQNTQPQSQQPEPVIEQLTVEEAISRLNALTGLLGVKKKVIEWVSLVKTFKEREMNGLPVPDGFSYHMVFTGNPGTGKTTVARLMAQIYRSLGILEKGQLIETARNDLVAGYIGQTAIKTQEAIDKALGGVLFVDEAYALAPKGSGNDFGQEAIDTILKGMEDHRKELVVIMAGYKGPMEDLLKTNEGLTSRFANIVEFEDYSGSELYEIFVNLCKKNKYVLSYDADQKIKNDFNELYLNRNEHFGNARTVRNFFQKVVEKQALRIQRMDQRTTSDMMLIELEDLPELSKIK